jgi:hypothetical protein
MTTKPKRHHFLPEFYLTGFTRDNYLWLYDRKKDEYRRQHPHNTAVIGHYYTVENPRGEKDYSIEGFLSQIEGKAKSAIVKLDTGLGIAREERLDLAFFITLQLTRTPKFEREIERTADRAAKLLAKHAFSCCFGKRVAAPKTRWSGGGGGASGGQAGPLGVI